MLVLNRHFKVLIFFFFSSRRRHTRSTCDWSSDVCSSDLPSWKEHVWFPTSPLKAIAAKAAGATVEFDSGSDPASAAALAKKSDVAIVFVQQWSSEDFDLQIGRASCRERVWGSVAAWWLYC